MKVKNISKQKIVQVIITSLILVTTMSMAVFAADNTYATNAADWIKSGAKAIVTALVAFFAIRFLAKRQFVQLVGFAVLAAIVLVIVYDPSKLQTVGTTLWTTIFG